MRKSRHEPHCIHAGDGASCCVHGSGGTPANPSGDRRKGFLGLLDVGAVVQTRALADDDLRARVVVWKSRFFARSWARYDLAQPGTFRLVPPAGRMAELARGYHEIPDMFLDASPSFEMVLETLDRLETRINRIV